MDSLSRTARSVLLGAPAERQCIATNRAGERCKHSMLGQNVCSLHGGKAPQSLQAARERLFAMTEPALDALLRALTAAPPCPHCGRSDADRDPVVIRAAQVVLDRAGLGPHATMEITHSDNQLADVPLEELEERATQLLSLLAELRASESVEGYVVPSLLTESKGETTP
jgi:hypothetical protein